MAAKASRPTSTPRRSTLATDPVAPGQLAYATSYGEIFELKSRAGKDDSVVFRGAAAIKSNSLGVVGADYTEAF